MSIELVAIGNFEGHNFGTLDVNRQKLEAKICLDRKVANEIMIKHDILGEVPSYKAAIYELCYAAFVSLSKQMEH